MSHVLQLLGPVRLRTDGRRVPLPHACARLTAALALVGPLSREQAAALLWPDAPTGRALSNLRTALSRLRRLTPGLVDARGTVLALADDVTVDTDRMLAWVNATIYDDAPPNDPAGPPREVGRELLAGWDEEWVRDHRDRWQVLVSQALESAATRLLAQGRPAAALPYGLAAVAAEPWSESANRVLIEIHARRGDGAGALRQFERLSRVLRAELGVQPAPDIVALIRQLYPFGVGRTGQRTA
ncbi:AfsR/SARP family transcriptional regulator [Cellulomonas fimi]|uniref:Transcriptional regulator, SARP family n=1 Tax=Cellulomonas fimi (strain ATCC 484 / DSM 20113 / JCM 1341 / CCUG 24087 / LMG 16345 / NBRC 15513 / NCIMB 8980 / NCTC 7547 / NRS-133) TaxID=590998 RepID=F4H3U3_CELFA|nr:BTAD domain-containing putative transcriptional regulator [Cellulomonas fimi]AEE44167.1 transcriptional regulator, SARP family [Cellulomonas fimi ATCC 484]NNH07568.1 SARP family transcriptional regulator [Cellulomonas fimi]VEH25801.1 Molybdopterin biosynthesis positive regulator [Cellulomonas fimi]